MEGMGQYLAESAEVQPNLPNITTIDLFKNIMVNIHSLGFERHVVRDNHAYLATCKHSLQIAQDSVVKSSKILVAITTSLLSAGKSFILMDWPEADAESRKLWKPLMEHLPHF